MGGAGLPCRRRSSGTAATEPRLRALLDRDRIQFPNSEGVSETYKDFPISFFGDKAFSGFVSAIQATIEDAIAQ